MQHISFLRTAAASLVVVFALPLMARAATNGPDDLTIVGGKFTNDSTPTLTWDAVADVIGYEADLNAQGFENIGKVTSTTLEPLDDGWYTFSVRGVLRSGAKTTLSSVTFEIDTEGPTVPTLVSSSNGLTASFSVAPVGDAYVTACSLSIDGADSHVMARDGKQFIATHAFAKSGEYSVRATCQDGDGNVTKGEWFDVAVSSSTVAVPSASASAGDRIKLACPSKPLATDPCHAVYYVADDGLRHLIPTEDVYNSWFSTWTGITTVSAATMAALPLGENVTYRPGGVLVKFASDDAVYAIERPNVLRHYVNAWLVQSDYGSFWPWYLRVLPDMFLGHYTIGEPITSPGQYDPDRAWAATDEIDDLF